MEDKIATEDEEGWPFRKVKYLNIIKWKSKWLESTEMKGETEWDLDGWKTEDIMSEEENSSLPHSRENIRAAGLA